MPWEIVVAAITAAVSGRLLAFLGGQVSKQTGHTKEAASELSLAADSVS